MSESYDRGRYKKIRKIGQGSYGSVIQAFDEESKKVVALKKIKFTSDDEGMPINALREIAFLRKLVHDNIVKIHQIYYQYFQSKLYITMELMPENLEQHCKRNFPLSPWAVKSYFFQLANAINYMHANLVMHRDIKPQNILVDSNGRLKICDFGQSKFFGCKKVKHSSQIGTMWYKAPQILLGHNYDCSIDIWALGCILSQIANGYPLFESENELNLIGLIIDRCGAPPVANLDKLKLLPNNNTKTKDIISKNLCEDGNNLLKQMLNVNPQKRIQIGKILKHSFLEGYS